MKTALILQGGGMRGAYTSGVLDQLMIKEIEFDALYGVSAGAKNGQYFISKQIGEAYRVDVYSSRDEKAISLHNLIKQGGIIDAEYYKNVIIKEIAPLNENFASSPMKFFIGATNVETGEMHYFEKSSCDTLDAIIASCSIPLIQKIKYIDGIGYLDGGIAEGIPLSDALKNYEKIVVVLTRPKGYREKEDKAIQKACNLKYKKYPNLIKAFAKRVEVYNQTMALIEKLDAEGKIIAIFPSEEITIRILEKNEEKIRALYDLGRSDTAKKIETIKEFLKKEE